MGKYYYIFLSCDDDVLIDDKNIELFLNEKLKSDYTIECIRKHKNIKKSKEEIDKRRGSCIYIVCTHKGLDDITSWELGYAMGSGLKVIGFWDGKSEIKIPTDVKELIDIPDDIECFRDDIILALGGVTPKELPTKDDWGSQYQMIQKRVGTT